MNQLPALRTPPNADMLFDPAAFEHAQRVATLFIKSKLIPEHMRDISNAVIALNIARNMGEDPLTVMQNIFIVSGRPGWYAQYMIARANRAGVFSKRIQWRVDGIGDKLKVTAYATLADTGEQIEADASMEMAIAEGWTKNPKYKSMPVHMLKWRSATFLIRLHVPEVMGGITATADELDDMGAAGTLREGPDGTYSPAAAPPEKRPDRKDYNKPAKAAKKTEAKPAPAASETHAAEDAPSTDEPEPFDPDAFTDDFIARLEGAMNKDAAYDIKEECQEHLDALSGMHADRCAQAFFKAMERLARKAAEDDFPGDRK